MNYDNKKLFSKIKIGKWNSMLRISKLIIITSFVYILFLLYELSFRLK